MKQDSKLCLVLPLIKGNFHVTTADKIKYLRSDTNIVYIIDTDDMQYVGSHTLKFYAHLLKDDSFFFGSQSYLINLKLVKCIDANLQLV